MNTVMTWLQSTVAERVGWMLVHSLWQLVLLAGAYLLVRQMLQRRWAALRYLVACTVLPATVLTLPLTAVYVDVRSPAEGAATPALAERSEAMKLSAIKTIRGGESDEPYNVGEI